LSLADRVVVDWRISEYELVDDNEASHVDLLQLQNLRFTQSYNKHYDGCTDA